MPPSSSDVEPRVEETETPEADAPRRRRRHRRSWAKRHHLGWITVGAAVLLLGGGLLLVVLTWDSGRIAPSTQAARAGTVAPSVVSTTGVPTTSAAPGVPVAATARGQVTAIGDGRLTMLTRSGLTYTVVVTTTTSFAKNRSFDDYPVGAGIAVEGMLDGGVLTATTISPAAPN